MSGTLCPLWQLPMSWQSICGGESVIQSTFPGLSLHWSAGLTFGLWLAAVTHERGSNQSAIRWHSPSSHHTPLTLHTCRWWHTFGNIVCSEDGIMFGGCNNCVSNIRLTIFFYQNMNWVQEGKVSMKHIMKTMVLKKKKKIVNLYCCPSCTALDPWR